jgi:hypothetical protein
MLRRWWFWAVAAGVVVAGLIVWLVWPSPPEPPRARPYLEYTGCLLTDQQGIAGAAARPAWAGLQDASLATHAKVQYLPVMGEQTEGNALPYLASLVQRRCAVIVAVGPAPVQAVKAVAGKYPAVRFVVVGDTASGANVTALTRLPDAEVRVRIRTILTDAVHSASPR